jgi:hypothetical protein
MCGVLLDSEGESEGGSWCWVCIEMWYGTDGEPDDEVEVEPNDAAAAGSESEEGIGSASA